MSEINKVRSTGTLETIDGRKYRGYLEADEEGATFYARKTNKALADWRYNRLHRMDNIRLGGTSTQVTVILKDDSRFIFDLDHGMKVYNFMDEHWLDKPQKTVCHAHPERSRQKQVKAAPCPHRTRISSGGRL